MKLAAIGRIIPSWKNVLLALLAAVLLILAFPDFELWWMAWFALVPLMWAVERQKHCVSACFILGWLFGTVFFFGTCWWLTFAPITYAGFPPWLAYSLMLLVAGMVGLFPAIFAGLMSILLRRFETAGLLAAPFVWVSAEFLRYWVTGNNWNALGYSQAFGGFLTWYASFGGVGLVSFTVLIFNVGFVRATEAIIEVGDIRRVLSLSAESLVLGGLTLILAYVAPSSHVSGSRLSAMPDDPKVIALQPNVPMSGLDYQKWHQLRQHQVEMAEAAIKKLNEERSTDNEPPITVILPESPMNFMYNDDREFQQFIGDFARRNNVSVLFNSAEPDKGTTKYFNSAVMVGPEGKEIGEYDKIYLLPFGEAVPPFLEGIVPGFVGNFAYGRNYDLLPVGDARAGVMICFESHFGQLSRHYAANGADVIIEMTNDGYLGLTPVLRQHLANAVFRAVETNRPVLRVTNVGVTAYITERGEIIDPAPIYAEATRVWSVSKSDGSQTFYVRYGDWFAWLCSAVTLVLLILSFRRRRAETRV